MSYSIGIDLGTSSIKITAINEVGKIISQKKAGYNISRPKSNWAEQSPEVWKESLFSTLEKTSEELYKANNNEEIKIDSIGVSGQMHGLIALNSKGETVYPAIIWADNRTNKEVEFIKNKLSITQLERLGNPVVNSFTAPKLLWLKNNRPKLWQNIDKFLLPKDYIVYLLTGKIISEKSDASATLLFDIENGNWDKDIIRTLNLTTNIFPEVVEPGSEVHFIKDDIYRKLNLSGKKPMVVTAGGDAPITALAAGVTDTKKACISLGTAGQIITPIKNYTSQPEAKLHTLNYSLPGTWFVMGAILAAGYNLSWWLIDICAKKEDYLDKQEKELSKLPPGSNGLIYLPHIQGERSPYNNPHASGVLFGLKSEHSNLNIIKAMMEGVAFAIKANFNIINQMDIQITELYLTGGGTKSKIWAQIFSDVLNHPVYISKQDHDTSYGAAILAAEKKGSIDNVSKLIDKNTKDYVKLTPNPENHKLYKELYSIYHKLYIDNEEKMNKLSKL